jgi:CRP-like cAMP-binding protein
LQGALGPRRSFTRATIQVGGAFAFVQTSRFEQITNGNLTVRDLIANYTEVLWAESQQLSICNAVHGAAARLCRWLLQCTDRVGKDELPLTQEFLAQMLGVRRTTVTLLAQAMQAKGMIRYSRGRIAIVDRDAMTACACECYHVTHTDRLPQSIGVSSLRGQS